MPLPRVSQLAAGIAEMVTSTVQSAREGISRPFATTSDKALGVASSGYRLTWSAVSGGLDYVLNSAPVRLAGEGADAALTLTEHLVSYLLPASAEEMGNANILFTQSVLLKCLTDVLPH